MKSTDRIKKRKSHGFVWKKEWQCSRGPGVKRVSTKCQQAHLVEFFSFFTLKNVFIFSPFICHFK